MVNAEQAVALVIGLFVAALMAAFLMPVVIGAIGGPDVVTQTQAVDETVELQPGLNATVTAVTDGTSATYTVTAGGDSVTGEVVDVNSSSTVTVGGTDVTITPTSVSASSATTEYQSPTTYGWGGGAGALWGILPVLLVLAIFLFMVAMALRYV